MQTEAALSSVWGGCFHPAGLNVSRLHLCECTLLASIILSQSQNRALLRSEDLHGKFRKALCDFLGSALLLLVASVGLSGYSLLTVSLQLFH